MIILQLGRGNNGNNTFLSKEEIEYLTGRKQKTAIIAQLKKWL
ncbi:DUF4224 domain-containing protein [Gallibacterium anatis]|uniref:DUF4224 domain-containing protein n=1 Tax=Gallibacterium anatis TaxID=750 RepID=A0A930YAL7_9PAST|nr:DUF4224 domain-containing protein [Gallibacterium anatis]